MKGYSDHELDKLPRDEDQTYGIKVRALGTDEETRTIVVDDIGLTQLYITLRLIEQRIEEDRKYERFIEQRMMDEDLAYMDAAWIDEVTDRD